MEGEVVASEQEECPRSPAGAKKDNFWASLLCCWLLGTAFLFPWNAILTIEDYYYVVFPHYHPSRVFTLIYEPVALVFTCIFTWYEARCSSRLRVLLGYGGYLVFLLLLIVVDLASRGHGSVWAYVVVCFIIAGLAFCDGTAQGALLGDLSYMDPIYVQAYSGGLAMSGILTTVLRMVTKVSFSSSNSGLRRGALTFFAISILVQVAGFLVYALVFPRLRAVKSYRLAAQQQGSYTVADELAAVGIQTDLKDAEVGKLVPRLSVVQLCTRNWDYMVDQVVIYTISLCIFPGFLYEDTGHHKLGSWYSLVLVALYNAGDFMSRYFPLLYLWDSRKGLFIACLSRALFIPCFYFAAKYAAAGWMFLLCLSLGLTNGYLSTCIFMIAPRGYTSPEKYAIGNILVLSLIVGLTVGVTAGWLWLIGTGW